MAATKKNLAVRAQKDALRAEINQLNDSLKAAVSRVPAAVINGSHQVAVAWKEQAEKVAFGPLSVGAKKATSDMLEQLRITKAQQLQFLQRGAA